MRTPLLAAVVSLSLCPAAARATLVAYEGFNTPVGQNIASSNSGTGFFGPWDGGAFTIRADSLSDPSGTLVTSGNKGEIAGFITDR